MKMDLKKMQWYKALFSCLFGDSDSEVKDDSQYQAIIEINHEAGSTAHLSLMPHL